MEVDLAFELGAGLICGTTAMAEVRGAGLSFETWAHVVCSLRDDELALYVNGARAVAVGASRGLPITSGALAVGGGAPDGTAEWVGAIDDVRIYRAPLTDTEIIAHFKAGRLR